MTYYGHAPLPKPSFYERSLRVFAEGLARPEVQADPKRKKRVLDAIEAAAMLMAEEANGASVALPPVRRAAPAPSSQSHLRVNGWRCERCTHEWVPRVTQREPKVCPKCKSPYWNRPRKLRHAKWPTEVRA